MAVPLSVPLAPNIFLMHNIQFAYTRSVPCTAESTDPSCVEIVLRATPARAGAATVVGHLHAGAWTVGYPSRFVCASNPLKMGSLTAVGKPAGNRADTASSTRGDWVMNC
jgi:hypothetical protein